MVIYKGLKVEDEYLRVHYIQREDVKFAVAVTKRIKTSVRKNRIKRLLREAYRLTKDRLKNCWLFIFAKESAQNIENYHQMKELLYRLFDKADLFIEKSIEKSIEKCIEKCH